MKVKVYEVAKDTGEFQFKFWTDTRDIEGEDPAKLDNELERAGRAWIGGGAAPLFFLKS